MFINCLFVLALENVKYIAEKLGETFAYEKEIRETREAAQEAFFVAEDGAFTAERGEKKVYRTRQRARDFVGGSGGRNGKNGV